MRKTPAKGRKRLAAMSYPLLLLTLFVVSFAVPIVFAARVLGFFNMLSGTAQNGDAFGAAREMRGSASQLQVLNSDDLQPTPGEDFLVVAWFKLLRTPKPGDRIALLSKYDGVAPAYSGYAVELQRKGDDIVPQVYWRDAQATGRWYSFSKVRVVPKSWFMVALSFQDDRTLGLHIASLHLYQEEQLQLLGGYKFAAPLIPQSSSDLLIGGLNTTALRGMVGPIGVFSGPGLSDDYQALYAQMLQEPGRIPEALAQHVRFWSVDGRRDLSPAARKVRRAKSGRDSDEVGTEARAHDISRALSQGRPGSG